jgi:hypothetical protein
VGLAGPMKGGALIVDSVPPRGSGVEYLGPFARRLRCLRGQVALRYNRGSPEAIVSGWATQDLAVRWPAVPNSS